MTINGVGDSDSLKNVTIYLKFYSLYENTNDYAELGGIFIQIIIGSNL